MLANITLPPSGKRVTVRRDATAVMLATEAAEMLETFPDDDPTASYLRDELMVAVDALRLGISSALAEEPFAAMVYIRVIVETAIRMSWLLTEGTDENAIRTQLARLEKHDLEQIVTASEKMDQVAHWGAILENDEELRALLSKLSGASAPDVRTMAKEDRGSHRRGRLPSSRPTATSPRVGSPRLRARDAVARAGGRLSRRCGGIERLQALSSQITATSVTNLLVPGSTSTRGWRLRSCARTAHLLICQNDL